MTERHFDAEAVAKLKKLVDEGIQVMYELESLKSGLRETVNEMAEELEIKSATLNKAIKIAYKASMHDERSKLSEVEEILDIVGKNQ